MVEKAVEDGDDISGEDARRDAGDAETRARPSVEDRQQWRHGGRSRD